MSQQNYKENKEEEEEERSQSQPGFEGKSPKLFA